MGDNTGILKVIVVHGKKLAIRDFTSSDPYVIVRLGNKTVKTKVIKSSLNPVWNEEFRFDVIEPLNSITFEVYDKDMFKYDDKMGHAFLDLQPIFAAFKLRRALQLENSSSETKLRKVAADSENCLLADSFVMHKNGEIVFEAWLRLRDVETGNLFVVIKWVDCGTNDSATSR